MKYKNINKQDQLQLKWLKDKIQIYCCQAQAPRLADLSSIYNGYCKKTLKFFCLQYNNQNTCPNMQFYKSPFC